MKIMVLDNYGSFSLVSYLKEGLPEHEIVTMGNVHTDPMWKIFERVNPDIVFVDFCDDNAVHLTKRLRGWQKGDRPRVVIRLHGFEAQSWYLDEIDWGLVSHLIVVSPKFREIVEPKIKGVSVKVVYNGVDLSRFQLQDPEGMDENQVAYVGYINKKKGPTLLRTVMASWPEKQFHVGGIHQDAQVQLYMNGVQLENVTYYGWVRTADFLIGKKYIISTSVTESFGMSIAEGMAMGLTPLVHEWPGADLLWPKGCIWRTFEDLKAIEPKDPEWCREWVSSRYSMKRCVDSVVDLLLGGGG